MSKDIIKFITGKFWAKVLPRSDPLSASVLENLFPKHFADFISLSLMINLTSYLL